MPSILGELILRLLAENRFPAIWLPTKELLDLRAPLLHRHQWVRIRTRVQNALQAIALANGLRRGPGLWSYDGQAKIAFMPLPPHASYRRSALQTMYKKMEEEIETLTQQVAEQPAFRRATTHDASWSGERSGVIIRKRCISRPTEHQAILLQHLNLQLPNSLEMARV